MFTCNGEQYKDWPHSMLNIMSDYSQQKSNLDVKKRVFNNPKSTLQSLMREQERERVRENFSVKKVYAFNINQSIEMKCQFKISQFPTSS